MTTTLPFCRLSVFVLVMVTSFPAMSKADSELKPSLYVATHVPEGVLLAIVPGEQGFKSTSVKDTTSTTTEGTTEEEDGGRLGKLVDRPTATSSTAQTETSPTSPTSPPSTTSTLEPSTLNDLGSGVSSSVSTPMRDTENIPPHITFPLSKDTIVVVDQGLTVCCKAEGVPPPSFEWERNGVRVPSEDEWLKASSDGCLQATQFTNRENGLFQCRASNKYGVSLSQIFYITTRVDANISDVYKSEEEFWVTAGTGFRLSCGYMPETLPATQKRWYQGDKTDQVSLSERVAIDGRGDLHFSYVIPQDAGTYKFGLVPFQNEVASKITLYNRGSINVRGSLVGTPDFRPQVQYATIDQKAMMFKDAQLECYFAGKPIPTMTWRNRSNHELSPSSKYTIEDSGRRLIIHNIAQNDNGTYTCSARNSKETITETLHLTVIAPPIKIDGAALVPTTVPNNRDVTLNCKTWTAAGLTLNRPKWWRNAQPLTDNNRPDPARYSFSSDMTSLTIRNLDKVKDTAAYQCNVTNSVGYLFMDGYLRVIDSIEITKRPADVIVLDPEEPEDIELTVLAKGDHCCEIDFYWTVNGSQFGFAQPLFKFNASTNRLTLKMNGTDRDGLSSIMGDYRCRVSNLYQEVDVNFKLQLTRTPGEISADVAGGPALWWIAIVVGVLVVLIIAVIVFAVVKGYYPRSTYLLEKTELKHNLNPQEDLLNQSFQEI